MSGSRVTYVRPQRTDLFCSKKLRNVQLAFLFCLHCRRAQFAYKAKSINHIRARIKNCLHESTSLHTPDFRMQKINEKTPLGRSSRADGLIIMSCNNRLVLYDDFLYIMDIQRQKCSYLFVRLITYIIRVSENREFLMWQLIITFVVLYSTVKNHLQEYSFMRLVMEV